MRNTDSSMMPQNQSRDAPTATSGCDSRKKCPHYPICHPQAVAAGAPHATRHSTSPYSLTVRGRVVAPTLLASEFRPILVEFTARTNCRDARKLL